MLRKTALSLLVVAGVTACCRAPGHPTEPTPRPGVFAQHAEDLAAARAARPRLMFLGDSITNRWRSVGRPVWDRWFAPRGGAYLGVGEDRVEHLLWRLRSGEFDGLDPEVVVVMIGTNNLGRDRPADIARAVQMAVEHCRSLWPRARVLTMGILPRGDRGAWRLNGDIRTINRTLAGRMEVLDIGSSLVDGSGYIARDYAPDGVHLSEAGYERWAEALAPVIDR